MDLRNSRSLAAIGTFLFHAAALMFLYFHSMNNAPTPIYSDDIELCDSSEILFKGDFISANDVINNHFDEPAAKQEEPTKEPPTETPKEAPINKPDANIDNMLKNVAANSPIQSTTPTTTPNNNAIESSANSTTTSNNQANNNIADDATSNIATNGTNISGSGLGSDSGHIGDYNVPGFAMAHWEKPQKKFGVSGSITVSITVSRSGMVISAIAKVIPEELKQNPEIKTACEEAARNCSFIANYIINKPTQKGTITYKIE